MIKYNFRYPAFTPTSVTSTFGAAIAAGNVLGLLVPSANHSFLITEIDWEGGGTSSAWAEFGVFRYTTAGSGTVPTTVPVGQSTLVTSPTANTIAYQGNYTTTNPTLAAQPVHTFGLNANGQRYFWRANPNLDNAIAVQGTATAGANGIAIIQIGGAAAIASLGRIQISEF